MDLNLLYHFYAKKNNLKKMYMFCFDNCDQNK